VAAGAASGTVVVEVVDQMGLSALPRAYRGSGSASYPATLLALLIYGWVRHGGILQPSSRAGAYDSVAFSFIACNEDPASGGLNCGEVATGIQYDDVYLSVCILDLVAQTGPWQRTAQARFVVERGALGRRGH
jgi:hypothetical protein